MSKNSKKITIRVFLALGVIFLLLGFIHGFISWQLGLILFVFCLVGVGLVRVVIADREEETFDQTEISEADKK